MAPIPSSDRVSDRARVIALPQRSGAQPTGDDAHLVRRILDGDVHAKALFFDRYGAHVRGIIVRSLGHDVEVSDLVHDVFVSALADLPKLKKHGSLKSWLTSVAVFRARRYIRTKTRRRWLQFRAPEEVPEQPALQADESTLRALAAAYAVLDTLPADDRMAFALRFLNGMENAEAAAACRVSESTFKRRVKRAREAFEAAAARVPALLEWMGERS